MRSRLRARLCVALLAASASFLAPTRAFAELSLEDWRFGVGAYGGFAFAKAKGQLETTDVFGPQATIPAPDPLAIQEPLDASSIQTSGLFLGTVEVLSPRLFSESARAPRLLLRADVGGNFGQEDDIDRFSDPSSTLFLDPLFEGGIEINPDLVLGQGARVALNTERLTYGAGIGFAIDIGTPDRPILLKPTVEYQAFRAKATGFVSRAIIVDASGPNPNGLEDFRHILLDDSRERTFHGAGVGLEMETEAWRAGSTLRLVLHQRAGREHPGRP